MNINGTIIGQSLAMIVFVWFCMKYVWPPITAKMTERQKKIADGLSAADRAKKDLELAQNKISQELKQARDKSASIIDQANRRSNQIIDEAKQKANQECDRIKQNAQAEIDQEFQRAKELLRHEVASIAIKGAEKVIQSSIDETLHKQLLDDLVAEL